MNHNDSLLPGQRLRARGADSNRAGRYEATDREAFDDGWDIPEEIRQERTEVRAERARSNAAARVSSAAWAGPAAVRRTLPASLPVAP